MQPFEPAAVYAPLASPEAWHRIEDQLIERRLYLADCITEDRTDLALPVWQRPAVLRHAWLARSGQVGTLLCDDLTVYGSPAHRVAVVGAMKECGLLVLTDDGELDDRWYRAQMQTCGGYDAVGPVLDRLLERGHMDEVAWLWAARLGVDDPLDILTASATTAARSYSAARMRARELAERAGTNVEHLIRRLSVEGYRNPDDRVLWYPKVVRSALAGG
jgi:hypothetical protein